MEICGINLHLGRNESRKRKEQNSFSNSGPWLSTESMSNFHSYSSIEHIFDQLYATNLNQSEHDLNFKNTDFSIVHNPSVCSKG